MLARVCVYSVGVVDALAFSFGALSGALAGGLAGVAGATVPGGAGIWGVGTPSTPSLPRASRASEARWSRFSPPKDCDLQFVFISLLLFLSIQYINKIYFSDFLFFFV